MGIKQHLIDLINQLETAVFEPLYSQELYDKGHWNYIAYSISDFLNHMKEAYQLLGQENLKFIDVGCGIGTKVALASFYFDAYGVELNQKYVKAAKKITRAKKFLRFGGYKKGEQKQKIFQEDALQFDYSNYDVIYYFRPMRDNKMQKKLENRIWRQAKDGAIIIPIYAIGDFPKNIRKIPTPSGHLYAKDATKALTQKAKELFS